jgi:hypothetical protein
LETIHQADERFKKLIADVLLLQALTAELLIFSTP